MKTKKKAYMAPRLTQLGKLTAITTQAYGLPCLLLTCRP
jgi:hypothetical protein